MVRARQDPRRLIRAGLGAALAAACALRAWLAYARYFDTDETVHLHASLLVAHGQTPFRDFFGHHGPLFWAALAPLVRLPGDPFLNALAGRAVVTAFWAAALLLVAARRRGEDELTGPLAAAWCAFFGAFLAKSLEVRPDNLALPLVLGAAALLDAGGPRRELAAGVLLGSAGWCTPKAVFAAAGLLAGHAYRARRGAFVVAGAALAAVAGVAAFAARGALRDLWALYVVYNAGFPGARVAWAATLRPSLLSDPLMWALGAAGLRRWRERPLDAGALVLGLAGLAVSPSAYPQYLLLVAPFLARSASAELLAWARARRARGVPAAAAVALSCAWPAYAAARAPGNALQRERYACVGTLPPGARVWDSWGGDSFARPHASKIWFLPGDAVAYYDASFLSADAVAALKDPRTLGAIRCESCLSALPPAVAAEFDADFRPSGCGRLWVRKEAP